MGRNINVDMASIAKLKGRVTEFDTTSYLAARGARSFAFRLPQQIRGRGEDRVRAAPAVSCAMCIKQCCT